MSIEEILKEIEILEEEIIEKKKKLTQLKKSIPEQKVKNYQFITLEKENVSLLDLFKDKDELIVIHNMGKSCAYCTMWADGFNGVYEHLIQKAAFVLSSPDSPDVIMDFAASRGWRFPIVSTQGTTFKQDLGFEKDGHYIPGVSTFKKDKEGNIYHIAKARFGSWDDYNIVWYLFDLLPSGSNGFIPKINYNSSASF